MEENYGIRSVILAFSGLEVQGKNYDEFFENLVAVLGSEEAATAYVGMRRYEVNNLVDSTRESAANGTNTASDPTPAAVRNVESGLGGQVLCDAHGNPARKQQVKKPGANQNRFFWGGCNSNCNFFQWA